MDWRAAPLSAADAALCAFAERLSEAPWRCGQADVDALREHGFSDRAIHDAVQVIGYFAYINRVADGLGTNLEPGMPPAAPLLLPPRAMVAPPVRGDRVTLEPITKESLRAVLQLAVSPAQQRFVASVPVSLAQAHVHGGLECLAIAAGGEPVGFVMLEPRPAQAELSVVRFLIDRRCQRQGFGKRALELVLARARGMAGIKRVVLTYVPAPGSPEAFYRAAGFTPTGVIEDGETELALALG